MRQLRRNPPGVHKSRGRPKTLPKEPNYEREEILLERNSRRHPLPARNTQNKVRKNHNLGRKKRRYPKRVEPWKEGDFSWRARLGGALIIPTKARYKRQQIFSWRARLRGAQTLPDKAKHRRKKIIFLEVKTRRRHPLSFLKLQSTLELIGRPYE